MNSESRVLIVGHDDVIESSLRYYFKTSGYKYVFSSSEVGMNPAIQASVYEFFQKVKPEYVFLGSTRSGGIEANIKNPAEFIYHNMESQNNVVYAAWKFGAKKLLYYAGSCIYPKNCPQPMKEDALLTGPLEETSEPYSVAKIAGVKLCQAFRKQHGFNAIVMVPATVYGPGADVNLETAHVIGALIVKFTNAVVRNQQKVTVWGTGQPRREFLYIDDFVKASVHLMDFYKGEKPVNVGTGKDVSIRELVKTIVSGVRYTGEVVFDETKPDGVMQKLLDSSFAKTLEWKPEVTLEQGIKKTVDWYKEKIRRL